MEARLLKIRGRNAPYLSRRLRSVVGRYGITPRKAKHRVRRCMDALERFDLAPTFATPGRVVEGDPAFFRELAGRGAELAVHGYDHVDLRRVSRADAAWQFARAVDAYERHGIGCDGFRCPYLSYTPELEEVVPAGFFTYSSNQAVAWDVVPVEPGNPVFTQLGSFYGAARCDEVISTPTAGRRLVEIPASVPDDLQLCDALGLGEAGLLRAWKAMLNAVHGRGELFAPLFHPESFDLLEAALLGMLEEARAVRPAVWLTQLRDVGRWWRQKEDFAVTTRSDDGALQLDVDCSDRGTVLVREWPAQGAPRRWDGAWSVLDARRIRLDNGVRPFVGVAGVDAETVSFLVEQGYVIDDGERAPDCTLLLHGKTVDELRTRVALVRHIESSAGPLLKFSRWPEEAKSAFCFAGDLDALSLRDYGRRLSPRSAGWQRARR
jgi:hypothetical protein